MLGAGGGGQEGALEGKFYLSVERGRVKMSTEFCMWQRPQTSGLRFYLC